MNVLERCFVDRVMLTRLLLASSIFSFSILSGACTPKKKSSQAARAPAAAASSGETKTPQTGSPQQVSVAAQDHEDDQRASAPVVDDDISIDATLAGSSCHKADADTCRLEKQIFDLTNAERAKQGLPAFNFSGEISFVAREWSKYQARIGNITHGNSLNDRIPIHQKEFGRSFRPAAENVAYEPSNPVHVVTMWMESAGHRDNIMQRKYRSLGVGLVKGADGWYASQIFSFD